MIRLFDGLEECWSCGYNTHMIENKIRHEKYVLAAVYDKDEEKALAMLSELALLTDTAGGECVCKVTQHLETPNPSTYIGKGKAEEISALIDELGADGVICDDELTAVQIRNLSDILNVKVIDRTILILDIFAAHAMTSEGKLQVEMAQLEYRASHLAGIGKALSRLGGGIGTRGPGESKLETDKRAIRRRISSLRSEVKRLKQNRDTGRQKRTQSGIPVAAIVGYTNAGKSTLLNRITNAGVKEEDRLFATLDPATRLCTLPDGMEVLFTDTVGFISKLPHDLIDAFRSTLEEAKYADIIIHVVDASDPEADMHMDVVYETLHDLGITGKPVITVFNKMDLVKDGELLRDIRADMTIRTSMKNGDGKEGFLEKVRDLILRGQKHIDMMIPFNEGDRLSLIRRRGRVIKEEYLPEGTHIEAYVPESTGI